DLAPLREAVHRIAEGRSDVAMFTTSIQILHLFRIAAEEHVEQAMRDGLRRMVIASIGPTTTETLEEFGLEADITPSHPKMGFLVKETAEQAAAILQRKRGIHAQETRQSVPTIRQILRAGIPAADIDAGGVRDRICTRQSVPHRVPQGCIFTIGHSGRNN